MATFSYPILISEDFNGFFTAQVIGLAYSFTEAKAFSDNRAAAIAEVREFLQWFHQKEWWLEPPTFNGAALLEFRVEARPEYEIKPASDQRLQSILAGRRQKDPRRTKVTISDEIPLRVACVYWRDEAGNLTAFLPFLDTTFAFDSPEKLRGLVELKSREILKGKTAAQLAPFLPPKEIALETVSFNISARKRGETVSVKQTPNLAAVAEPLGADEKSAPVKPRRALERDNEIIELTQKLGKERASVILLGESGVGKTTVLREAVRRIESALADEKTDTDADDDFNNFFGEINPRHRYWLSSGARLIAGMKYLGQWEERVEKAIAELSDIEGVLCVENLLELIKIGGREPLDSVAAFLAPFISRGELRVVAELNTAELDACRRLLPNFTDLFQVFKVADFTEKQALSILTQTAEQHSRNRSIEHESEVISTIYTLFTRFQPYQKFPSKIIDFLDALFAQATTEKRQIVTAEDAIREFVRVTGLPEIFLRDDFPLDFDEVAAALSAEVVGQEEAVRQTAQIVTTFKAGLNDPRRPLGVMLFTGPTGVGKTELAKALARFVFGHGERADERLVRLDMSEYGGFGAASRIVAGADGEPSEFLQKVRALPFCVVLFDEIEKADPQVFDILLNLFDEGKITDKYGRITDFRSAIIILTSNLGAEKFARGAFGFNPEEFRSADKDIQNFFRPEFFNRLDSVVQFHALTRENVRRIALKEIEAVGKREGLREKNIKIKVAPELLEEIVKQGFDARYGARPLQRTIENLVTSRIAKHLIAKDLHDSELYLTLNDIEQNLLSK